MYKSLHDHRATELSGNPQAWPDFMGWATHHHTSLMNATISCFLHQGEPFPVATEKYFLLVSVAYRNDPTLPRERQFEMRGAHWSQKSDPSLSQVAPFVDMGRVNAVEIGKIEYGRNYRGTGSYLISVRFRPDDNQARGEGLPFVKHFAMDAELSRAVPACRTPLDQLKENLQSGKKMRFCCGSLPGLPTCRCGGWTHVHAGPNNVKADEMAEQGLVDEVD